MYNNSLENIKNVYSDVALVYNLETEKTNSLATETYNLLTNVTSNVTTLKNKISILGDMLTDLRVLNGSAKNIIPLTDLKIIENNGIRIKDNKFELNYINNELKEIDANLSSITSVVPYSLYSLDGKESYLTDLLKTKNEVKIKFPNKNYTFELNLRYQSVEQINTIALQLGLLTESYPDILSIKYIDTDNTLKDIIILDTNTRNYSLNDNRVKDNLYIFNITPVATDQIIIELSSRDSDSLIVKGIETYYSNILQNGYIILGPVTTEDPILKLAIDSTNITSGVKIEVSTDKDYWIELNNSSSIGLNGTKKILSINTIGNNSIKNDQDIYSIYIKISIASSILSNENLDISVYNTLREDSTIGNDLLNSIEDIRLSAYRVSSSDFNYGNYMYSSAINLLKFPLDKIETIQNNGVSKVLGLVESKYSITNSSNTTNVIGSVGAELKLHRLNADKTIDASGFDLANSLVHDVYSRYIEETINIKQKDNLCLMLKQRNKNNLPSIPEVPDDSTIIATSYDGFYQTMTVQGESGVEVQTLDELNNILGSGTIDETGTVTYSIDEGMLRGGSSIITKAISKESNSVSNSLVSSFYLASDTANRNYLGFTVYRDLYLNWLDDEEFNNQYDESFSATLEGQMIVEYSTGEVIEVNLADYQGSRWGFYLDRLGINSPDTPSVVTDTLISAKVRFKNLNDQIYLWVNQGTHYYKFFDDNLSNVGYGLAFRNSLPDAIIKQLPEYLPPIVTNLNCMFWGDQSDYYNQYLCESAEVESVLANWDVSNVKTMVDTFAYTSFHDLPVSNWTPTALELSIDTFAYTNYDNPIDWITPNLVNTSYMFEGCLINSPINLTMDSVTTIEAMFDNATVFNQPIGHWNVSTVSNFSGAFAGAIAFNQSLNTWNVSTGTNFNSMFSGATAYNQPMNTWDVSNTVNQNFTSGLYSFLSDAISYSQDLSMWCVTVYNESPTDGYSQFNKNGIMTAEQMPKWGTCPIPQIPTISEALYTKMTYDQTNTSNVMWIDFEFAPTNTTGEVYIDWGDGTVETHKAANYVEHNLNYAYIEHPYAVNGEYIIKVYSTEKLNWIEFGEITKVLDWGSPINLQIQIPSIYLTEVPTTLHPDMTDLTYLFGVAKTFNQDISMWDTSNVTNMSKLFHLAEAFNQDISSWNVSNVSNMESMFYNARAFNSPLNTWDTRNVTNMSSMFSGATIFNQNINSWDVSNVTDMAGMFNSAITFNQPLNEWDVNNVTSMNAMFRFSEAFNQDLSMWCVPYIIEKPYAFDASSALTSNNLPVWGTCPSSSGGEIPSDEMHFTTVAGSVDYVGTQGDQILLSDNSIVDITATGETFTFNAPTGKHKVKLVESVGRSNYVSVGGEALLELHNFPTLSTVTKFNFATYNYNNLPNLTKVPNFLPSNITNMTSMFTYASAFNQDLSNWNVSNVTSMSGMFEYASSFNQPLNNWDVSNVTSMSYMFSQASSFSQPLNNWNVSNVTDMEGMFSYANSFNQDLSNWDVSNVTNISEMFANASAFNQPLNNWNVSNVTDMRSMFDNASSFNQPLNNWNVSNVTSMLQMFRDASAFNQDLSNWCVSNIPTSPAEFDLGATNWTLSRPVWGTCPTP